MKLHFKKVLKLLKKVNNEINKIFNCDYYKFKFDIYKALSIDSFNKILL